MPRLLEKAKQQDPLAGLKSENERLKAELALVEEKLEQQNKVRWKMSKSSQSFKPKGVYFRLVIPDSHGASINKQAMNAVLADVEALKPKQIVWIGDHVDCGGFLAQHHTLGYVAECSYTFSDDVEAANTFLDEVAKRAPGAEQHYLEGNHEQRIERWCVTTALRQGKDANFLMKFLGPANLLRLKDRGIHWWNKGGFHHGLPVQGCIKLGKCYFTHGKRVGRSAGLKLLADYGYNIVYGHTHTADVSTSRTVKSGEIAAWNPGFLGIQQPYYDHSRDITPWSHGYHWQVVDSDGGFLPINVPVIRGRSYVASMLQLMGL